MSTIQGAPLPRRLVVRHMILAMTFILVSIACLSQSKAFGQTPSWTSDPDWEFVQQLNLLWAGCASIDRDPRTGRFKGDRINPEDPNNRVRKCISSAEKDGEDALKKQEKRSHRPKQIGSIFRHWKIAMNCLVDSNLNRRYSKAEDKYQSETLALRDELMATK